MGIVYVYIPTNIGPPPQTNNQSRLCFKPKKKSCTSNERSSYTITICFKSGFAPNHFIISKTI